jgi:hypothetical protein
LIAVLAWVAVQGKQAERAIKAYGNGGEGEGRDALKSCMLDLYWWYHLVHWNLKEGDQALTCLRLVMKLASELHRHNRFTIAVKVPPTVPPTPLLEGPRYWRPLKGHRVTTRSTI